MYKISFIGVAAGVAGLLFAIVHIWAGPASHQRTFELTVADKAVSINEATIAAHKVEDINIR